MKKIIWYLEILPKLGIYNVLYVMFYRFKLKAGLIEKKYPIQKLNWQETVFNEIEKKEETGYKWKQDLLDQADKILNGKVPYYSYHWLKQTSPPNWFTNQFNGKECKGTNNHWSRIPDFHNDLGDIKNVWELSRFSWVGILARAYRISANKEYLNLLNQWLTDWIKNNPVNMGHNWKCGQEASFRVFNLLNAADILQQIEKPSETLVQLIISHLQRISGNIQYAKAQRNNHATSEGAALFIGGSWLLKVADSNKKEYTIYINKGRRILEKLSKDLTYEDGSFAQHSIIYHRLFLDTMTTSVYWAKKLNQAPFTKSFYTHVQKSMDWMLSLMDESGRCSNLGSNDGAMLLTNHTCNYLDCRPSLQLASALFNGYLLFNEGAYDEELYWKNIDKTSLTINPYIKQNKILKSGYVVMVDNDSWGVLRYPHYKFRPSHNDVFHFDLWAGRKNLLFDSGSYSYNPDKDANVPDLKSVKAHNTLSFDGNEQMPRLGRFLLAKWIKPLSISTSINNNDELKTWEGKYKDNQGNTHQRETTWSKNIWNVTDTFSGNAKNVEIGFNFKDDKYQINQTDNTLILSWGKIKVSNQATIQVQKHTISNYYFQSEEVNRLIISCTNNNKVTTIIQVLK